MSMRALRFDAEAQRRTAAARECLSGMSDTQLASMTSARLIASYGLSSSEADHLIRSLRRV